ncbi:hypothetical protein BDV28DRAFT_64092 [Aspergillus coremiiformis]|uniref:Uncharacterized protein n=1 Tax=Aspergillus coremiiformis TaxID=138285 RepID=A0A5N6YX90_9EURO|nr:hypothetical protein BDV28DRAFT_64092 [Aspergillus coremiiformis]
MFLRNMVLSGGPLSSTYPKTYCLIFSLSLSLSLSPTLYPSCMPHLLGLPRCSVLRSCVFLRQGLQFSNLSRLMTVMGLLSCGDRDVRLSHFISSIRLSLFSIGMLFMITVDVIRAWEEFYPEGESIWQHKLFQDRRDNTLHVGADNLFLPFFLSFLFFPLLSLSSFIFWNIILHLRNPFDVFSPFSSFLLFWGLSKKKTKKKKTKLGHTYVSK